jgi:P27 family predicted phage terminase small subunit
MGALTPPPTPKGLKSAGRALWRAQLSEFEASSPAELALLEQACLTVDELAAMKTDLAEMGLVVSGSTGQPRINPLVSAIAAHRKLLDQLVVSLGIPLPSETVGRRRSAAAKQSADARWRKTPRRKGRLGSVEAVAKRKDDDETQD